MEVSKKSKDGKKKREKSSKGTKSSSRERKEKAAAAAVTASGATAPKTSSRPLSEFEMGELFSRYASGSNNGGFTAPGGARKAQALQQSSDVLTRDQLKRMLDDLQLTGPAIAQALDRRSEENNNLTPRTKFDLGMLFARHDPQGTGVIDRQATQAILHELSTRQQQVRGSSHNNMLPYPQAHHVYAHLPSGPRHWESSHATEPVMQQPNHLHSQILPPYVPNGTRPMPPYVPKHLANHNQRVRNNITDQLSSASFNNSFDFYSLEQQQQQHERMAAATSAVPVVDNQTRSSHFNGECAPSRERNQGPNTNGATLPHYPASSFEQMNVDDNAVQDDPQQQQQSRNRDTRARTEMNHHDDDCDHRRPHRYQSKYHKQDSVQDAAIRQDYLGFRSQVDAALASRKHHEVRVLSEIAKSERQVKEQAREYTDRLDLFVERMRIRIGKHFKSKHARLQETKSQHARALETMYRFEQLAYGSSPRDAIQMHSGGERDGIGGGGRISVAVAATSAASSDDVQSGKSVHDKFDAVDMSAAADEANTVVPPALPSIDSLDIPSLVEFVRCFPDLRATAERIAYAPIGDTTAPAEQEQQTKEVLRTIRNEPWDEVDVEDMETRAQGYEDLLSTVEEKDEVIGALVEERDAQNETQRMQDGAREQNKANEEIQRQERREFDKEKQDTLQRVQALADASTAEVASWMQLTEKIAEDMGAQIAALQEECRVLKQRNFELEEELVVVASDGGSSSGGNSGMDEVYGRDDSVATATPAAVVRQELQQGASRGHGNSQRYVSRGRRTNYKHVTIRPELG